MATWNGSSGDTITLGGANPPNVWSGTVFTHDVTQNNSNGHVNVFFEKGASTTDGFELRAVGAETHLVMDSDDNIYDPGFFVSDLDSTPRQSGSISVGEVITIHRDPYNGTSSQLGTFTVSTSHMFSGGSGGGPSPLSNSSSSGVVTIGNRKVFGNFW